MRPRVTPGMVFNLAMLALLIGALATAAGWSFQARLFPWAIGIPAAVLCALQLVMEVVRAHRPAIEEDLTGIMDLPVDRDVPTSTVLSRAGVAFAWVLGLLGGIIAIGFVVSSVVFVLLYLVVHGRMRWYGPVAHALIVAAFVIGVFDHILHVPWPRPLLPGPEEFILHLVR